MLSSFAALVGIVQAYFLVLVIKNLMTFDEHEEKAIATIDRSRAAVQAISQSIKYKNEKR